MGRCHRTRNTIRTVGDLTTATRLRVWPPDSRASSRDERMPNSRGTRDSYVLLRPDPCHPGGAAVRVDHTFTPAPLVSALVAWAGGASIKSCGVTSYMYFAGPFFPCFIVYNRAATEGCTRVHVRWPAPACRAFRRSSTRDGAYRRHGLLTQNLSRTRSPRQRTASSMAPRQRRRGREQAASRGPRAASSAASSAACARERRRGG